MTFQNEEGLAALTGVDEKIRKILKALTFFEVDIVGDFRFCPMINS